MRRIVYWVTMVVLIGGQISTAFAIEPPGPPIIPQVSANPSNLTADGVSTAIITAVSIDEQGNPQVGANAYFYLYPEGMGNISTTLGYVDGKGWFNSTDSNGRAMATFTAGTKAGNVTVVAIVGIGANNIILKLEDTTPPIVTSPSANPSEILLQEQGNADYAHMSTTLSVMATDASGVAGVTINLSSINGSGAEVMASVGGNVYSVITNATGSPGSKSLGVTATDANGNSNASVSILLNVLRNGDVDGSGAVNLDDAIYLANHALQVPGFEVINTIASDVDGSGTVNLNDAIYLANHVLQVPGFEKLY